MTNWQVEHPGGDAAADWATVDASALYERYRARVYAFCLDRLGDREEAADAVQDTFVNAWVALRGGCRVRRPLPWLLTIASNVCVSRYRSRRARVAEAQLGDDVPATVVQAPSHDLAELRAAVRALPDVQRRAFVLRELHGYSYEEIARELGVSDSSVTALLHRSRRAVAARLRGVGRRALVVIPVPGLLKSAFDGGAATVMATGAATIVVMAPQIGTGPPRSSSPPPASVPKTVTTVFSFRAAAAPPRGEPEARAAANRTITEASATQASANGVAPSPSAPGRGTSRPTTGGETIVDRGGTAPPEAPFGGPIPATQLQAQEPVASPEPPLADKPDPVSVVASPAQPDAPQEFPPVPGTWSSVSPSREMAGAGPSPHASGVGAPAEPGSGADPEAGAPGGGAGGSSGGPGGQGSGPPPHANAPAEPGSGADPEAGASGGGAGGSSGGPGGQGSGPPPHANAPAEPGSGADPEASAPGGGAGGSPGGPGGQGSGPPPHANGVGLPAEPGSEADPPADGGADSGNGRPDSPGARGNDPPPTKGDDPPHAQGDPGGARRSR